MVGEERGENQFRSAGVTWQLADLGGSVSGDSDKGFVVFSNFKFTNQFALDVSAFVAAKIEVELS